ncbi:MAG: dockerin type I domain-containing protein, partial [bacterium]|nr:dockerin type I domain-containing protein [bacterium]
TSCSTNAQCPVNNICRNGRCGVLSTPSPTTPPSPSPKPFHIGDLNRDFVVNVLDLSLLVKNMLQTGDNLADLNKDSIVDITDYSMMLRYLSQ